MIRALLVLGLWLGVAPAYSGDREADILVVRLDDGADPASKGCFGRVRAAIAGAYAKPVSVTREAFLKAAGAEAADDFLSWPVEKIWSGAPKARGEVQGWDAIVVVDCRPGTGRLHAVVATSNYPPGGSPNLVRLVVPGASAAAQKWLIAQVIEAAWLDFSP